MPPSSLSATIPIAQVDAFTERPFAGNPAAVCVLEDAAAGSPDPSWMQAVAAEMNLSETAFVTPLPASAGGAAGRVYDLRWFTPSTEVDLCGHATLASAHLLWESGRVPEAEPIRFETRSGGLTCELERPGEEGRAPIVWMDFPAEPADPLDEATGGPLRSTLTAALGVEPVRLARNRFDLLVELDSEDAVRSVRPDMARLGTLEARGILVTAAAAPGDAAEPYDFVSRFFGPRVGVPEDPVTGSAHCCLAPWWGARFGRDRLVGRQVSRRGGTVRTELVGARVRLGGPAVTVFTGGLRLSE